MNYCNKFLLTKYSFSIQIIKINIRHFENEEENEDENFVKMVLDAEWMECFEVSDRYFQWYNFGNAKLFRRIQKINSTKVLIMRVW